MLHSPLRKHHQRDGVVFTSFWVRSFFTGQPLPGVPLMSQHREDVDDALHPRGEAAGDGAVRSVLLFGKGIVEGWDGASTLAVPRSRADWNEVAKPGVAVKPEMPDHRCALARAAAFSWLEGPGDGM